MRKPVGSHSPLFFREKNDIALTDVKAEWARAIGGRIIMTRTVYLNGQFVPESEAKLSIYDLSVMQAAAAFEMTRSFKFKHFKLPEHLQRLEQSCKLLSIPLPSEFRDPGHIEDLCYSLADRNDHGPGEEHRLLIVVSPGCAPMYKDLEGVIPHPFVYIADFPLRYTVKGFSTYFTEGVHCVTSQIQQVHDACIPSQAKHRSRLHFHLAQQQAPPGTWPLLRSIVRDDYCGDSPPYQLYTEAPGANIVWWDGYELRYIDDECLDGISMQTVLALLPHRDAPGDSHDLRHCHELWLTGTPFCMLPVVSLDGTPIGDGTIGPVFKETLAKWSALVGVDIQQQICDWDTYGPGPRDPALHARWNDDKEFLRGNIWTPSQQRKLSA